MVKKLFSRSTREPNRHTCSTTFKKSANEKLFGAVGRHAIYTVLSRGNTAIEVSTVISEYRFQRSICRWWCKKRKSSTQTPLFKRAPPININYAVVRRLTEAKCRILKFAQYTPAEGIVQAWNVEQNEEKYNQEQDDDGLIKTTFDKARNRRRVTSLHFRHSTDG